MDTQKIKFVANRPGLNEESASKPGPIIKTLPDWYRKADRFAMNAATGKPWELPDGRGKIPTWKACLPCDREFARRVYRPEEFR